MFLHCSTRTLYICWCLYEYVPQKGNINFFPSMGFCAKFEEIKFPVETIYWPIGPRQFLSFFIIYQYWFFPVSRFDPCIRNNIPQPNLKKEAMSYTRFIHTYINASQREKIRRLVYLRVSQYFPVKSDRQVHLNVFSSTLSQVPPFKHCTSSQGSTPFWSTKQVNMLEQFHVPVAWCHWQTSIVSSLWFGALNCCFMWCHQGLGLKIIML